jgi:hypothetical protein
MVIRLVTLVASFAAVAAALRLEVQGPKQSRSGGCTGFETVLAAIPAPFFFAPKRSLPPWFHFSGVKTARHSHFSHYMNLQTTVLARDTLTLFICQIHSGQLSNLFSQKILNLFFFYFFFFIIFFYFFF